ncbi:hypothetical protein KAR91_68560 [Candidatus Pacearchaeota archaeon]|nr:hypothetical protein [Candidatus Pacearchaeota archaeon]
MTIDYINRTATMTIECDICGEIAEFDGDYKYCITEAKRNGWIVKKHLGDWYHFCSIECRKKL